MKNYFVLYVLLSKESQVETMLLHCNCLQSSVALVVRVQVLGNWKRISLIFSSFETVS